MVNDCKKYQLRVTTFYDKTNGFPSSVNRDRKGPCENSDRREEPTNHRKGEKRSQICEFEDTGQRQ